MLPRSWEYLCPRIAGCPHNTVDNGYTAQTVSHFFQSFFSKLKNLTEKNAKFPSFFSVIFFGFNEPPEKITYNQ